MPKPLIKRHPFPLLTITWSPDGRRIASAGISHEVWIWDATSGRTLTILHQPAPGVQMVAWSPDGTRLAAAGEDGVISLWDTATGELLLKYGLHRKRVSVLAWSPDGMLIASSSEDTALQIWKAATGERVFFRRHGYYKDFGDEDANALAWAPDGKYLAFEGSPLVLTIWDVRSAEIVDWQWDEDHILFTDTLVYQFRGHRLLCNRNGGPLAFFKGQRVLSGSHARIAHAITCSPDGKYLALQHWHEDTINVERTKWEREIVFRYAGHTQPVTALDWSPDGRRIASASQDRTVHIWRPELAGQPLASTPHST